MGKIVQLKIGEENVYPKIDNRLLDDLYYKPNDVIEITLSQHWHLTGMLTNSAREIQLTFYTEKSLKYINNAELQGLKLNIRKASGGYIGSSAFVSGGYDFFNDSNYSFSIFVVSERVLNIVIKNTDVFNETNNTPVVASLGHIKILLT